MSSHIPPTFLAVLCVCTFACAGEESATPTSAATPAPIQIGDENAVVVREDTIATGPIISGELRAAREATVRAELGGSILQIGAEEGQSVRRGALLARIEATTLDDTRRSAESAVRAAESQLELSRREAARTEQLVGAGALATRDLDVARGSVATTEAQLADARSRLVSAQKQLGDAIVRSPIDGIVADRPVNTGDVVTSGTALFTIIDPSSMRLEASVQTDDLGQLRVGVPVVFTVRGYEQSFTGQIERISPLADPGTRQVPIFVKLENSGNRLVSGLYAEGRVTVQQATGLVVDTNAVNTTATPPWVLRVRDGKTERVEVTIGVRDDRTERVQITSGVVAGDVLLRGPAQGITPGTAVSVNAPR